MNPKPIPADPYRVPAYLMDMPASVLKGKAKGIVAWCAKRNKQAPTLLHLDLARRARGGAR